jgi:hypothetical protein
LVRVADETRWRGQAAVATALVVAVFWLCTWLLGQPVRPGATALAAIAVALPTLFVASLSSGRRIRERLRDAGRPPRASVHETIANSRDRRLKLAGIVLTGIIALLVFDRFTGGGGIMAGLVAGLLGSLGAADWMEASQWDAAERERETRIFALIRPDALTPRLGTAPIFEAPRPGSDHDRTMEPSPFDLEI